MVDGGQAGGVEDFTSFQFQITLKTCTVTQQRDAGILHFKVSSTTGTLSWSCARLSCCCWVEVGGEGGGLLVL